MCSLCQRQWAYPITVAESALCSKKNLIAFGESIPNVSNYIQRKRICIMHEWFEIRSGCCAKGFPAYIHKYTHIPRTSHRTIMSVSKIENALLNYFRHLISFSYWEWWYNTYLTPYKFAKHRHRYQLLRVSVCPFLLLFLHPTQSYYWPPGKTCGL